MTVAYDDAFWMTLELANLVDPRQRGYVKRFEKAWVERHLMAHRVRCRDNLPPLAPGVDSESEQKIKPDLTHHQRWARSLYRHQAQPLPRGWLNASAVSLASAATRGDAALVLPTADPYGGGSVRVPDSSGTISVASRGTERCRRFLWVENSWGRVLVKV